jgi:hypothetical protein
MNALAPINPVAIRATGGQMRPIPAPIAAPIRAARQAQNAAPVHTASIDCPARERRLHSHLTAPYRAFNDALFSPYTVANSRARQSGALLFVAT